MANFPVVLSYGVQLQQTYNVKRTQFGDGYSQRSSTQINPVRQQWTLVWSNVTRAEAQQLKDFFDGLKGTGTFDWVPEGSTASKKFSANNFTMGAPSYDLRNCQVTAIEEFDA